MNILIIDAQGGGIGRQLVAAIRERLPEASLTAVGTNSAATSAMLKAGVAQADAKRILIPINHCDNIVVGVSDLNIRHLLEEVLAELEKIAAGGC